jgi:hypothetical protein
MDFSQVSVKFDLHLTVTIQPHELSFLLSGTCDRLDFAMFCFMLAFLTYFLGNSALSIYQTIV